MTQPVYHAPSPSQRNPRPRLSKQIRNTGTGTGARQSFGLPIPKVGTAWLLEAFTISMVGPQPLVSEDLVIDLVLSGETIDTFNMPSNSFMAGSAVFPISVSHSYQSPYTIFDTDSFQFVQRFSEQPAAVGYLDYRVNGTVRYL